MIIIYTHGSSEGKQMLLQHAKKSSLALHQYRLTSLVFFHFSVKERFALFFVCSQYCRIPKCHKQKAAVTLACLIYFNRFGRNRNVIYYSLFISATITLQNPKENNVIEVTCLLPCRNLKQPQARANTDVVQGIKRVLDAVASNYPGI